MHYDESTLPEFKENLQSLYSDIEYIEKMVSYALFELKILMKKTRELEYADAMARAACDD